MSSQSLMAIDQHSQLQLSGSQPNQSIRLIWGVCYSYLGQGPTCKSSDTVSHELGSGVSGFSNCTGDSHGQLGLRTAVSRRYIHLHLAPMTPGIPSDARALFPATLAFVIIPEPLLVTGDYEEVTDHFLSQECH